MKRRFNVQLQRLAGGHSTADVQGLWLRADKAVRAPGWWRMTLLLAMIHLVPHVTAEIPKPEPVWEIDVGLRSDTCAAIADDGTIYFGTPKGELFAVTAEGEVRWTRRVGDEVRSSPAIGDDGVIYFGSRDRHVYGVLPEGQRKWRFKTGGWVDSSPAIAGDGSVIVGSWDKTLYCLGADGAKRWEFKTGGPVTSSPGIGLDGTVYFGSHDGKLYALNPDGTSKWAYQTGGQIISSPAINGADCIYITSVDGFLHAVNLDGSLKWKLKTGGITESSPVIAVDGTIHVGVNRELWSISSDGEKLWSRRSDGFYRLTPCADASGFTYCACDYGYLRAVSPAGVLNWQFNLSGHGSGSPALGQNGVLYISGRWTNFFALQAEAALALSPWPKFRGNSANTGNAAWSSGVSAASP